MPTDAGATVELKTVTGSLPGDADEGTLEAVFSVFDVVDRDGDVVLASALEHGTEVPLVWAHDWRQPIGKGTVRVDGDRAVFTGRFFTDTAAGNEAYRTVKNMGALQQYSWGFRVLDSEPGERDGKSVRLIKRTEPFEVSPVLVGANQHTSTLSLKEWQALDAPPTFADRLDRLSEELGEVVRLSRDFAENRAKEGRALSAARRERLRRLRAELDELLAETEPAPKPDATSDPETAPDPVTADGGGEKGLPPDWRGELLRLERTRMRARTLLQKGTAA